MLYLQLERFYSLLRSGSDWKYVPLEDKGYNDIFYCEADSRYRLELIKDDDAATEVPSYAYTVPHANKAVWYYKAYLEKDDLKLKPFIEMIMLDEGRFALPTPEPGCYSSMKPLSPKVNGRYVYYVEDSQKWRLLDFFNLQNIWEFQQSDFRSFTEFLPIFKSESEKKEFDEWVTQKERREEIERKLGEAEDEILPSLCVPEIENASEWDKGEIYLSRILKDLLEKFRKSEE